VASATSELAKDADDFRRAALATRGGRACAMAVGLRRHRSHAAHRGFVERQLAEARNLFWMCAGKMSA
jgi:hypothetical protein